MDAAIILISVFAIFIPALMLPGPDFVAVVRTSMTKGTSAGLLTTLGVTAGLGLYASLSLLGLSAILVEYQWLTWLVRILGGSYLIYLGIKLVFTKPQAINVSGGAPQRGLHPCLFGFLVTMTNPKAIVLFASVFATAITDTTPVWLMGVMIGLVMTSSLVWYSLVSLFMSSTPVIMRFQNARHWIERAAGVCFVAIGGRILSDAPNPVAP
ncbi:MAG: LysE family transporter [Alphaproteobacteria bacterium]|nr:LysE family transporter [Alphaproteobacteria bacterium]